MRIIKINLALLISTLALIAAVGIPLGVSNFTQVHVDRMPQGGTATPRLMSDNKNGSSVILELRDDGTPVARWADGGGYDLLNTALDNIDYAQFNLEFDGTNEVGQLNWNNTEGALEVGSLGGQVVLQMGQEMHIRGVNKTAVDILDGQSVTIVGASGNRTEFALTDIDDPPLNDFSTGLATEDIDRNQQGYVTTFGLVRGLDTSDFDEGDRIWGTTMPGVITNVVPTAPDRKVFIGIVVIDNQINGSIFVNPVNVLNLSALSDILITSIADQDIIWWDDINSRWKNETLTDSLDLRYVEIAGDTMTGPLTATDVVKIGGATNYAIVDENGDTWWVGEGGLIFGSMFINGTDIVVPIANTNPTEVGNASNDGWASGELNLITFPTGGDEHYLTITTAGKYEAVWNMSFHTDSGGKTEVHAGVAVDGIAIRGKGETHRTVNNTQDAGSISSTCILDLLGTEQISLWVINDLSNDLHIEHGTVVIKLIGGT